MVIIYNTWCFSDLASWIDYTLITNLMHWLLFIHKILFSSTCFEPQVLIFRRIQLYTCRIWYCHSVSESLVACRYTAWVRTDCGGRLLVRRVTPCIVINNTFLEIIQFSDGKQQWIMSVTRILNLFKITVFLNTTCFVSSNFVLWRTELSKKSIPSSPSVVLFSENYLTLPQSV